VSPCACRPKRAERRKTSPNSRTSVRARPPAIARMLRVPPRARTRRETADKARIFDRDRQCRAPAQCRARRFGAAAAIVVATTVTATAAWAAGAGGSPAG
jgi:hypothetical protein